MKKIPIILDTDPGTDINDLFALGLALRHPSLRLLGVTTVYGDTEARARLVAKMLRLAGRPEIPVAAGVRAPASLLKRGVITPDFTDRLTHTQLVTSNDPESQQSFPDAIPFILEQLEISEESIGLVGIGAWSNLAAVIEQATPRQRSKIRFLALMGGETHLMWAEHNVGCDPESAEIVLNSDLPIFMGTLTVTRQIFFPFEETKKLFENSSDPFLRALWEATEMWRPFSHGKPGPVLYDIVPLFRIFAPELIQTKPAEVHVELEGKHTYGFTIADFRKKDGNVRVSMELDCERIKKDFLEIIMPKR